MHCWDFFNCLFYSLVTESEGAHTACLTKHTKILACSKDSAKPSTCTCMPWLKRWPRFKVSAIRVSSIIYYCYCCTDECMHACTSSKVCWLNLEMPQSLIRPKCCDNYYYYTIHFATYVVTSTLGLMASVCPSQWVCGWWEHLHWRASEVTTS